MQRIPIKTNVPYEVWIGSGLLCRIGEILSSLIPSCRIAVITDDTVRDLYGDRITGSLRAAGFNPLLWHFPPGEASKNMETLDRALRWLAANRITRGDLILALGGGVPGDLAGFAAAVYCRGIRYVQVPTTLLAAVDASVGGKTAVNLPEGKNMAGAFHQPAAVICDTDVLRSLPDALKRDGSAEMLKYGMLCDPDLFSLMAEGCRQDVLEEIVARCVRIKRDHILRDETDHGVRRFLNLGHTFGHAIEKCSGYTLTHGQAVGMGLLMAACAAGIDASPVRQALIRNGLPVDVPFSASALAEAALSDKKFLGEEITLVLPERIGACFLKTVSASELPALFDRAMGGTACR